VFLYGADSAWGNKDKGGGVLILKVGLVVCGIANHTADMVPNHILGGGGAWLSLGKIGFASKVRRYYLLLNPIKS
jgi:hypothetical protein